MCWFIAIFLLLWRDNALAISACTAEMASALSRQSGRRMAMNQHMPELPLIDRLKIAAQFVVPIVKEMEANLGAEQAHTVVRRGIGTEIRRMARQAVTESGGDAAAALTSMNAGVRQGVDIQTEMRPATDGFEMDVTDCVYARFFQELGEPELGFLLVCSADFDIVEEL